MKKKLLTALLIAGLLLLVPFLIGRVSVAVLNLTYPTPELPSAAQRCQDIGTPSLECQRALNNMPEEAVTAMRSLARARAITKIALVIIGVYYLALFTVWFVRRRRSARNIAGAA